MTNDDFSMLAHQVDAASSTASRRFRVRLAEAVFRRWPLLLLPIIAFGALGVTAAQRTDEEYRSVGLLKLADTTLLADLTSVRGDATFSYESVATRTARSVNELLRSDSFLADVADRAGFTDELEAGVLTLDDVRSSVYATPDGDSLLAVVSLTSDPNASFSLATATIDGYIDFVVQSQVTESQGVEQFFLDRRDQYESAADDAREALEAYLIDHPEPADGSDRPIEEEIAIQRLNSALTAAESALATNEQKIEEAQLATDTSIAESGEKLKVIDAPQVPSAPEPTLQKKALTVLVFLVLGGGTTLAAAVLLALVDRSVRTAQDLGAAGTPPVVSAVPELKVLRHRDASPELVEVG